MRQRSAPAPIGAAIIALVAAVFVAACTSGDGASPPPSSTENNNPESDGDLDPLITQLSSWETDFSVHSVPLDQFLSGGPSKDGIPAIDDPQFTDLAPGDGFLAGREPVLSLTIAGDARAYPLRILTRHEIVNDVVGGVPVAVTFCPLCNSAIVFERELDGVLHDFGVSGVLRNSDLVMYDRQTETWWQQFTGEAIVGQLTGTLLEVVASQIVSWSDFKDGYPNGQVLSRDTGLPASAYDFNPYIGYDSNEDPFLFRGEPDTRLSPIERVVGIEIDGSAIAYPFSLLEEARVIADSLNGQSYVIFHQAGTASALDQANIAESRDVGAAGVFAPEADGRPLTFRAEGDDIFDDQTGSRWNVLGVAVDGPLEGARLAPVPHGDHFWFAWSAFMPDTEIYGS